MLGANNKKFFEIVTGGRAGHSNAGHQWLTVLLLRLALDDAVLFESSRGSVKSPNLVPAFRCRSRAVFVQSADFTMVHRIPW